jgi:hypothetical protein
MIHTADFYSGTGAFFYACSLVTLGITMQQGRGANYEGDKEDGKGSLVIVHGEAKTQRSHHSLGTDTTPLAVSVLLFLTIIII